MLLKRSSAEKAFKAVGLKWWSSNLEGTREFNQFNLYHLPPLIDFNLIKGQKATEVKGR